MTVWLDHIAVAVEEIDSFQRVYEDLGLIFEKKRETVASQGVTTAFASVGSGAQLELVEPSGSDGPIHKFLQKRGPGIHHLCFRVPDVGQATEELKKKGYRLLNDRPVAGAQNCLVNFIHPQSTGGVLIEISTPLN